MLSNASGGIGALVSKAVDFFSNESKTDKSIVLEKNSLVTVGQVSANTVRVRLGAENMGSSGPALVPRTYNVPMLVLTRWSDNASGLRPTSLEAVTHTTFYSTDTGTPLTSDVTYADQSKKVEEKVREYGVSPVWNNCSTRFAGGKSFYRKPEGDERKIENNLALLRALARSDYGHIEKCLNVKVADIMDVQDEETLRGLMGELMEIRNDSRFASFTIRLKERTPFDNPKLPDKEQLVTYSDNGTDTSVVLLGGRGLDKNHIQASLQVMDNGTGSVKGKLVPTSIKVSDGGSKVDMTFPSLDAHGLKVASDNNSGGLFFNVTNRAKDNSTGLCGKNKQPNYKLIKQIKPPPKETHKDKPGAPTVHTDNFTVSYSGSVSKITVESRPGNAADNKSSENKKKN